MIACLYGSKAECIHEDCCYIISFSDVPHTEASVESMTCVGACVFFPHSFKT